MEGQAHAGEQDPNRRTVVGLGRGAEGKTMGHGTEENSETLKDLGHGSEADCGTVEQETTRSDPEDHGAMADGAALAEQRTTRSAVQTGAKIPTMEQMTTTSK